MKKEEKKQSSLKTKKLQNNSYHAVMIAIVFAIVIIVNLVASKLPAKYTKLDATGSDVYGITKETKQFIQKLEQDVNVYYLVSSGKESVEIETVLDKYAEDSSHIKVEKVDPSLHPTFTEKYNTDTSSCIIVESGERFKVLTDEDIFTSNTEEYYNGMAEELIAEFTGENAITSAIQYVTTENLPKMYILQEHQELGLDDTTKGYVEDSNIRMEDLSLIKNETVPEDCDCLLITSPQIDISADEKDKILDYLKKGGNAIFILDYTGTEMPNLDEVLKYYSLELQKGMIVEGDGGSYYGQANYVIPDVVTSDVTKTVKDKNQTLILPFVQGIKTLDNARDTLTITDVLKTSSKSYLKEGTNLSSITREMSDASGPFSIGTIVGEKEESKEEETSETDSTEESTEEDTAEEEEFKTKLAVFTSYSLVDSGVNSKVGNANLSVFLDTVGWMCEYEGSIIIPGKQLADGYMTVPSNAAVRWSAVYVFAIPITLLAVGIVVCVRRRRK